MKTKKLLVEIVYNEKDNPGIDFEKVKAKIECFIQTDCGFSTNCAIEVTDTIEVTVPSYPWHNPPYTPKTPFPDKPFEITCNGAVTSSGVIK